MSYRKTGGGWGPLLASVVKSMEAAKRGWGHGNKCQIVIGPWSPIRKVGKRSSWIGLREVTCPVQSLSHTVHV